MTIRPTRIAALGELPARLVRGIDPAIRWFQRELETARRDNLDAQFMATTRGSLYQRSDW